MKEELEEIEELRRKVNAERLALSLKSFSLSAVTNDEECVRREFERVLELMKMLHEDLGGK